LNGWFSKGATVELSIHRGSRSGWGNRVSRALLGRHRIGKVGRNRVSLGHADDQRDWLISDRYVRRPFRSQMGFVAGDADISDRWHLRWLHDIFHILSGRLLPD